REDSMGGLPHNNAAMAAQRIYQLSAAQAQNAKKPQNRPLAPWEDIPTCSDDPWGEFGGRLSARRFFYCISGAFEVSRSCGDQPATALPFSCSLWPREAPLWQAHPFLNPTSPKLIQDRSCTRSIAQTQIAPTARICGPLKSNGRDNAKSKTTLTRRSFGVNLALTHITKCATLHAFITSRLWYLDGRKWLNSP